jgi:hypothetical protein
MHILKTIEEKESPVWKSLPADTGTSDSPTMFKKLEATTTKKRRWTTDIELEYDPVQDLFIDSKTKRPVSPLLDSEVTDEYFDENTEIDNLEFDSMNINAEWIKQGGGASLDMKKVLANRR